MHPCTTLSRASVLKQLRGFYDKGRGLCGEDAFLFVQIALNHHVHFSLARGAMETSEFDDIADLCDSHWVLARSHLA